MRFLFRALVLMVLAAATSGTAVSQQKPSKKPASNPTDTRKFATIDGSAITESQARSEGSASLASLELQILKAKAEAAIKEQEILEEAVERLIEDKLLRAEAEKQGISKEELLSREVRMKVTEPTAEEIEAFYAENKQRIKLSKEDALPQIGRYLKQRQESILKEELLSRLETERNVVRLLEPLRFQVGADDRPSAGPRSAPVLLVEFSDFQCPYCKQFSATIKEVLKNYGEKVRLVFRQFPLTNIHDSAQRAAEASLCANAQGRFWEMHDSMFEDQGSLLAEDLKEKAKKLGMDVSAFAACVDSNRYSGQITEDIKAGTAAGVDGTPALFINGRFFYGSRPYEEIAAMIDEELRGKKK